MSKFDSSGLLLVALLILIAVAGIGFWALIDDRRRSERGLPVGRRMLAFNPIYWLLHATHSFKPCGCTSGDLLCIQRTKLMRSALPDHTRYRCTACKKQMLLDELQSLDAQRTRMNPSAAGA